MSRAANGMTRAVAHLLLASVLAWSLPALGQSADWALSAHGRERVETGAIIADGDVDPGRAAAAIRAAIKIAAPPEAVFRTLTDCAQALRFVPHLKRCAVLETGSDGRWQNVQQQIDYGWLVPRA